MLGNVYVLSGKAAEKMSRGEPPGCWVAPELLERIQQEVKAADKGLPARLERAARMVAVVRGLGYAGAYLGGEHRAEHVRWIIRRAESLADRWRELADEFNYRPRGGFFLYESTPAKPRKRGRIPRLLDTLGRIFPVARDAALRRLLIGVFQWVDKRPRVERLVERGEFLLKAPLFGCQACGNCVLGAMEYVCPQTCPKNLRNGPCGGTLLGRCEVVDQECIWVEVYERAKAMQRVESLREYIPPRNPALQGTSSWVNYFLDRDNRPGKKVALHRIEEIASARSADRDPKSIVRG